MLRRYYNFANAYHIYHRILNYIICSYFYCHLLPGLFNISEFYIFVKNGLNEVPRYHNIQKMINCSSYIIMKNKYYAHLNLFHQNDDE